LIEPSDFREYPLKNAFLQGGQITKIPATPKS
jgi:hypothetical protein